MNIFSWITVFMLIVFFIVWKMMIVIPMREAAILERLGKFFHRLFVLVGGNVMMPPPEMRLVCGLRLRIYSGTPGTEQCDYADNA